MHRNATHARHSLKKAKLWRPADTKTDAGSRTIELNRDATEAAVRLSLRASQLTPPATLPEHYLMPKHLSRIAHGKHKGERGYDPSQHQLYWDTAWRSLTKAAGLTGFRFHDLRHTFIAHMVERSSEGFRLELSRLLLATCPRVS